ncbi:cell cycle control cwf14 protein [Rutstroemia sp. NJR-2017a WRK4]|nr:cell cycle control cwf14 protein [Rutstroemia sp. NJR-2017a WRK4]
MPAIRHSSKRKAPPAGYSDIEDTLLTYSNQMKDAVAAPAPTGPRHQATWNITAIVHKRSRYIWDLYREEKISKELYDWCVKNGQCDAMLVAKWKKNGYENLCCLKCIHAKETNFNSTCICRVPKADLKEDQEIQCVSCGCRGCASNDLGSGGKGDGDGDTYAGGQEDEDA